MKAALILTTLCAVALVACGQAQTEKAEAPEAVSASTSTSTATTAAAESYVGTWAVDLASCRIPQEMQGAPHIFTRDGFDQHEAHCTFADVSQTGPNSWRVAAACQVEGDEASLGWDMTVDGDTMQMVPGQRLVRCP